MEKKFSCFFALLAVVLAACSPTDNNTTTTTTPGGDSSSNTDTTTSTSHVTNLENVLQKLAVTNLGLLQELVYQEISVTTSAVENEIITNVDYYIDTNEYYMSEYNETTIYALEHYFKDENGDVSTKELSKDNTVAVTSYEGMKFDESFINPFMLVNVEDLKLVDNGVLVENDDFNSLVYLLCGYDFSIESVLVQVDENDNPTKLIITSTLDDTYASDYGVYIKNTLTGTFASKETVNVPTIEPGFATEDHKRLKAAFDKLKAGNYTLSYHDIDFDGEYPVDITAVVTNTATLININGGEEHGYLDTDKGLVEFEVDKTGETPIMRGTTLPDDSKTVAKDVLSPFDFAPEVFTYLGNNRFTLPLSLSLYEEAANITPDAFFGDNASLMVFGTYFVTLKDDGSIQFDYMWEIPGWNYGGVTTVIADNFGKATFPYDINSQYEEMQPENWYQFSPDFATKLNALIGDYNKVPFYKPLEAEEMTAEVDESAGCAIISYSKFKEGTKQTCYDTYEQMLLDAGYEYKGLNDNGEDSYYLGTDIEVALLTMDGYDGILVSVYSHKVYVMPNKITWDEHDTKYDVDVKTKLEALIGDSSLIPCYDFEKQYWFSGNDTNKTYTLMAQSYADTFDEKGYYAAVCEDLKTLGYTLDTSSGKDIFNYKDQFTVYIDCSNRYCTITIQIL